MRRVVAWYDRQEGAPHGWCYEVRDGFERVSCHFINDIDEMDTEAIWKMLKERYPDSRVEIRVG